MKAIENRERGSAGLDQDAAMKSGWSVTRLGDLTDLVTKGTTPTSIGHEFVEEGINFVKVESITTTGQFIEEKFAHITPACHAVLGRSQLQAGDILFSIAGALGRTGFVTDDILPANTNQALAVIRLKHDVGVSPKFVLKALETGIVLEQIEKFRGGVAQQNLSLAQVRDFHIALPPLAEQQRIVGLLDEAFAGLATAKANAEKNLQNARALFESGLNSAVTGKLTREWRREHAKTENASLEMALRLTERRTQWTGKRKYQQPDAPITPKPIEIPDSWVLASPEQVTTHIVDCPHSTPKWAESGVLCLRTTNFKPGFLDLESVRFVSDQTYKERIVRLEPKSGDVLYSREGGILGIACMIPEQLKTCLGQRMMLFRADTALVLPEYFTAVLNSTLILSEVRRLTGGAASPHLNICDIRTFPIPLPPITEQRQIVAKLDVITAETQRLSHLYERKLAALEALKKSLLHQAFTGAL